MLNRKDLREHPIPSPVLPSSFLPRESYVALRLNTDSVAKSPWFLVKIKLPNFSTFHFLSCAMGMITGVSNDRAIGDLSV